MESATMQRYSVILLLSIIPFITATPQRLARIEREMRSLDLKLEAYSIDFSTLKRDVADTNKKLDALLQIMNASPEKSKQKQNIDNAYDRVNTTTLKDFEAKMWSELSRVKRAFVMEKKELRYLRVKYEFSSQGVEVKNTTTLWPIVDRHLELTTSSIKKSVNEVLRQLNKDINHTLTHFNQAVEDRLGTINWTKDTNRAVHQLNELNQSVGLWNENVRNTIDNLDYKIINFLNSSLTKQDEGVNNLLAEIKSSLIDVHKAQTPVCNNKLDSVANTNRLEITTQSSSKKLDQEHSAIRVRIVNSTSLSGGRLEVYKNGQWGTVCDDLFDDKDATVTCKMFGYRSGIHKPRAFFGQGTGPILMVNVDCIGTEKSLWDCFFTDTHYCDHSEDVGVICSK